MKSAEVRTNWREILTHVEQGGTVVIEHYNRPIAQITPYKEPAMARTEIEDAALSAANAWYDYIADAGYTPGQAERMRAALLAAEREEFEALLPEGSTWHPDVALMYMPYGTEKPSSEELREMRRAAAEAVEARYSEIETATLPDL